MPRTVGVSSWVTCCRMRRSPNALTVASCFGERPMSERVSEIARRSIGHKHNGNGFIESFRFAYLKAITGYDWTEENVRKLNQEIEKDVETPEVNKATTWPSVR